jgi:glycerol-3-phosphate dehydrogenase (NAD(P)+)
MTRLGVKLGGRAETLAGLCGLGDLVLTCSSPQSRNMSFGMELGRGRSAAEILGSRSAVTEGAETAPAVVEVGRRMGVDLPICEVVLDMIEGRLDAKAAVDRLLNRPMKEEA